MKHQLKDDGITDDKIQKLLDTIRRPTKGLQSEWLDNILFEIKYFYYHNFASPYLQLKNGIRNLWLWRKVIWNDRWYDYQFIMDIIAFKLKQVESNWSKSNYIGWEEDQEKMRELLEILKTIRKLEDEVGIEVDINTPSNISKLYENFGRELFQVIEYHEKINDDQIITKSCSQIEKWWD
jgi:hypothetical protein